VIEQIAGQDHAEGGANADRAADDPESKAEPAGVARDVGHNQRKHDAEDCGRYAVEQLRRDDRIRVGDEREQRRPYRQGGEAQEQQGSAAQQLRLAADPGRHADDDELRHNHAGADHRARPIARMHGQNAAHER